MEELTTSPVFDDIWNMSRKKRNKRTKLVVVIVGIIFALALVLFWINRSSVISYIPNQVLGQQILELSNKLDSSRDRVGSVGEKMFRQVKEGIGYGSEDSSNHQGDQTGKILIKIGLVSDSHGYNDNLNRALVQMKGEEVSLVVHLGDFTAGGEDRFFQQSKDALDDSGIPYFVLPGDHDFNWFPEYSRANYESAFGQSYDRYYVLDQNIGIVLLDNSVVSASDKDKQKWLELALSELSDVGTTLFFSPRPLFSPYFEAKSDPNGKPIIDLLYGNGVDATFAGNTHVYARYQDMEERLDIITVGAIGEYKNPLPQWVLVEVFEKGNIEVKPIPLVKID